RAQSVQRIPAGAAAGPRRWVAAPRRADDDRAAHHRRRARHGPARRADPAHLRGRRLMEARRRQAPHRERGVAVISVLLVVTLATLVVCGLFWREAVTVRSVEIRLALAQIRWVESAVLDW